MFFKIIKNNSNINRLFLIILLIWLFPTGIRKCYADTNLEHHQEDHQNGKELNGKQHNGKQHNVKEHIVIDAAAYCQDYVCKNLQIPYHHRFIINVTGEFERTIDWSELLFRKSNMAKLPMHIFRKFPYIKTLDIEFCGLQKLEKKSLQFGGVLEKLNLNYNNLTELTEGIFDHVENLKQLSISFNQISVIHPRTFRHLRKLKALKLRGNRITNIPENIFHPLRSLKDLILSHNLIHELHDNIFERNTNLHRFDISYNNLHHIGDKCFHNLSELEELSLANNNLNEVHIDQSVDEIRISYNLIKLLSIKGSVEKLYAYSNNLNMPNIHIDNFKKLKVIGLGKNQLTTITQLELAEKLEMLDISQNPLEFLPIDAFYKMENIIGLNISGIGIKSINDTMFSHQHKMVLLDLSDNNMVYLDPSIIASIDPLREFHFHGNQFTEENYNDVMNAFMHNNKDCDRACQEIYRNPIFLDDIVFAKSNRLRKAIDFWTENEGKAHEENEM